MKRLTLEKTWSKCLAMWRWIKKQLMINPDANIWTLKAQWLQQHDPSAKLPADCYFCKYQEAHHYNRNDEGACSHCPGRMVDPQFICTCSDYAYDKNPVAFLHKLEQLNRIRKGGK